MRLRVCLANRLGALGLKTLAASQANEGLALAKEHHPELIVLDLEIEGGSPDEIASRFARQTQPGQASLVLLGTSVGRSPFRKANTSPSPITMRR